MRKSDTFPRLRHSKNTLPVVFHEGTRVIRIRFHGRGGQGVKTAGRIVSTAAFMSGYHAQDAPLYGAERRGAPIISFTRISSDKILERGLIVSPDIIAIADETLLADSVVAPISGLRDDGIVFINTPKSSKEVSHAYSIHAAVVTLDLTKLAMEITGRTTISPAIAGVVCRLLGSIAEERVDESVAKELGEMGVNDNAGSRAMELARRAFEATSTLYVPSVNPQPLRKDADKVIVPAYDGPMRGTANIFSGGNAQLKHTGNWRAFKPVIDEEKCKKCNICFVRCPDSCIALDERGYPVIQMDNCKGCLICYQECPSEAILVEKEDRSHE